MSILFRETTQNKPLSKKLSLSTSYKSLHNNLWENKRKNCELSKNNTALQSKLLYLKENKNRIHQSRQVLEAKNEFQQLYAAVKSQEKWMQQTNTILNGNNLQKLYKKKNRVESRLIKSNKRVRQLRRKVEQLEGSGQQALQPNQQLQQNQEQSEEQPSCEQVLNELEQENSELVKLLNFRKSQLCTFGKQANALNREILELLQLKNCYRKELGRLQCKEHQDDKVQVKSLYQHSYSRTSQGNRKALNLNSKSKTQPGSRQQNRNTSQSDRKTHLVATEVIENGRNARPKTAGKVLKINN